MTTIHWLIQAAASMPEQDAWLTPSERAVLEGLHVAKRRFEWRLGRWTAKRALALCLTGEGRPTAWQDLEIRRAEDGAPEAFVLGDPAPCHLSISHRHGLAACALVARPARVGCDLERIEPRSDRFVADYFTEAEQALVAQAGVDGRALVANLLWSAKESALKAMRQGLRMDTRAVEVALPSEGASDGWHALSVRDAATGRAFGGWWRRHGEHVFTLTTEAPAAPPVALPGAPPGWHAAPPTVRAPRPG